MPPLLQLLHWRQRLMHAANLLLLLLLLVLLVMLLLVLLAQGRLLMPVSECAAAPAARHAVQGLLLLPLLLLSHRLLMCLAAGALLHRHVLLAWAGGALANLWARHTHSTECW